MLINYGIFTHNVIMWFFCDEIKLYYFFKVSACSSIFFTHIDDFNLVMLQSTKHKLFFFFLLFSVFLFFFFTKEILSHITTCQKAKEKYAASAEKKSMRWLFYTYIKTITFFCFVLKRIILYFAYKQIFFSHFVASEIYCSV